MFRRILEWPSNCLRQSSSPITKFDESTEQLAVDLIDTCNILFGAGLAAPQIGIQKRIVVLKSLQLEQRTDFALFVRKFVDVFFLTQINF